MRLIWIKVGRLWPVTDVGVDDALGQTARLGGDGRR